MSDSLPQELHLELEQSRATSARLLEGLAQRLKAPAASRVIARPTRVVKEVTVGIEKQIRKRPLPAILAAIVAGYFVGRAIKFHTSRAGR